MDLDRDVVEIHQMNMRRVQMAVAISVIRSKPPHLTAKEYATLLRNKHFHRCEQPANQTELFEKQKEILFNELMSVRPEPNSRGKHSLDIFNEDEEALLEDNDDADLTSPDSQSSISPNETVNNIQFIKSLVEIRTLTFSNANISTERYRRVLARSRLSHVDNDSPDSGLGSSQSSSILSGDVREIMRSQNVDAFLSKSMDIVWRSLLSFIKVPPTGVAVWQEDSLLDASVKAIVGLINNECQRRADCELRKLCAEYINRIVNLVVKNEEKNASSVQLLRCKVITELASSHFLCKDAINIIIEVVNAVRANLKHNLTTMVNEKRNVLLPNDRESMYFVFRVLKELLHLYDYRKKELEHKNKCLQAKSADVNVVDLWKREHRAEVSDDTVEETNWRDVLEQTVTVMSDHFPEIMCSAYRCLVLLKVD